MIYYNWNGRLGNNIECDNEPLILIMTSTSVNYVALGRLSGRIMSGQQLCIASIYSQIIGEGPITIQAMTVLEYMLATKNTYGH